MPLIPVALGPEDSQGTGAGAAATAAAVPTAAVKGQGRQGLRPIEELVCAVIDTAMGLGYYKVHYRGANLGGTKGQKTPLMNQMRALLDMDPRFKDKVPRAETLDR